MTFWRILFVQVVFFESKRTRKNFQGRHIVSKEALQGCPNHSAVRTEIKVQGLGVERREEVAKKGTTGIKWKQSLAPMS